VINLVGLASGAYRFEVKAVASEGRESATPATADFVILSPIWTRWWFIAAGICMSAALAAWLHRRRLHHALELERIRTRIATDLHDDVGASLSQIAILSEVAHRSHHNGEDHVPRILQEIAGTARGLVDSMSDIVWAIDPEHDRIDVLSYRMRRFAEDLCGGYQVSLTFRAPHAGNLSADAHLRREVYLILKESLHNAIRHSECTEARVDLQINQHEICLTVSDNGRGFDAMSKNDGHGLKSMRERAKRLGGTVNWESDSTGTCVILRAPLAPRHVRTA
jgi:signal transduction histidine kinase